jgi:cytochrome c-type biogenesis protein CcmE
LPQFLLEDDQKRGKTQKKGQRIGVCGGVITTSSNPPKKTNSTRAYNFQRTDKEKKIQLSETLGPAT